MCYIAKHTIRVNWCGPTWALKWLLKPIALYFPLNMFLEQPNIGLIKGRGSIYQISKLPKIFISDSSCIPSKDISLRHEFGQQIYGMHACKRKCWEVQSDYFWPTKIDLLCLFCWPSWYSFHMCSLEFVRREENGGRTLTQVQATRCMFY